jgi:hypothetical protein
MQRIVSAIVNAVLGYIKLWYDAERREAAEWEAKAMRGKMESMKVSDAVSKRLEGLVPTEVATTAKAWNEKARLRGAGLLFILCVFLFLPGCLFTKYVHIEGKWPLIKAPACPTLPAEPRELTVRETILASYATALEVKIDGYNKEAKAHNIVHGYAEADSVARHP